MVSYNLRVLTNEGDILVGIFTDIDELKTTLWSFKNISEFREVLNDKSPYFYYNVYN